MRIRIGVVVTTALMGSAHADGPTACSEVRADSDVSGCLEYCRIKGDDREKPSERFLRTLETAPALRHHPDSRLGPTMFTRMRDGYISNFGPPNDWFETWHSDEAYVGPCGRVVEIFRSHLIDDKDPRDAVDVWELRYPTPEEAARIARLLRASWNWNYHPTMVLHEDRSVYVIEGRHRARRSVGRFRTHMTSLPPTLPADDKARSRPTRR
jgi:hypothetical protein